MGDFLRRLYAVLGTHAPAVSCVGAIAFVFFGIPLADDMLGAKGGADGAFVASGILLATGILCAHWRTGR
jgi:hypothetical protein